jgi:hypothetical protein
MRLRGIARTGGVHLAYVARKGMGFTGEIGTVNLAQARRHHRGRNHLLLF